MKLWLETTENQYVPKWITFKFHDEFEILFLISIDCINTSKSSNCYVEGNLIPYMMTNLENNCEFYLDEVDNGIANVLFPNARIISETNFNSDALVRCHGIGEKCDNSILKQLRGNGIIEINGLKFEFKFKTTKFS